MIPQNLRGAAPRALMMRSPLSLATASSAAAEPRSLSAIRRSRADATEQSTLTPTSARGAEGFSAAATPIRSSLRSSVRESLRLLADDDLVPIASPAFFMDEIPRGAAATAAGLEAAAGAGAANDGSLIARCHGGNSSSSMSFAASSVPRPLRESVRESIDLYQGLLTARGIQQPGALGSLLEAAADDYGTPSRALLGGSDDSDSCSDSSWDSDDSFDDTPLWSADVSLQDEANCCYDQQQQQPEDARSINSRDAVPTTGGEASTKQKEAAEEAGNSLSGGGGARAPPVPLLKIAPVPLLNIVETRRSLMAELGEVLTARRNMTERAIAAGPGNPVPRGPVAADSDSDDDDEEAIAKEAARNRGQGASGSTGTHARPPSCLTKPRLGENCPGGGEAAGTTMAAAASQMRPPLAGTKKLRLKKNAGKLFKRILGK